MSKHKQSARLGDLSHFASGPNLEMSDTDRIQTLERRVHQLELLLNDVMHQLDNPSRDYSTGTPNIAAKTHGQKRSGVPSQKSAPSQKKSKPPVTPSESPSEKTERLNAAAKAAAAEKLNAEVKRVEVYLADGEKRTAEEIIEACDLSKSAFYRVKRTIPLQTNGESDPKLLRYWQPEGGA